MKNEVVGIILAGGIGKRMDKAVPKQFLDLKGKPVIARAITKFEKSELVSRIVIVSCKSHIDFLNRLVKDNGFQKIHAIVEGGKTRQESSLIGLRNCEPCTEFVLIHDAVRPLVSTKIIADILAAIPRTGSAGPVCDTADTIVLKQGDLIRSIPDRKNVKRIQTPQGFYYKTILSAHEKALKDGITDFTDDCGLVVAAGGDVTLVEDCAFNIKLTDQTDFFLAEKILEHKKGKV